MSYPNEWTQKEFLQNKEKLQKEGIKVILVDTILSKIQSPDVITYNPYEMSKYPDGTFFIFYCDTGKATLNRLLEYKKKFPTMHCISLKGGKGYWRKNFTLLEE